MLVYGIYLQQDWQLQKSILYAANCWYLQCTPTKQAIVGAGFVGLDFCPSSVEVVLYIFGQFALGDEPVEIIYKVMDGVFGSVQVIEVVIMLVFNEVLAHGLGQL